MAKKLFTEIDRVNFAARWESDVTVPELSKLFRLSYDQVFKTARAMGLKGRKRKIVKPATVPYRTRLERADDAFARAMQSARPAQRRPAAPVTAPQTSTPQQRS